MIRKQKKQSVRADALLAMKSYQPQVMLDFVKERLGVVNDADLAALIQIGKPTISVVRNKKMAVGATLLLAIHDASGISIKELKQLMGDTRKIGEYR